MVPASIAGEAARPVVTIQPVQQVDVDVAVVGSGFAGALAALALRQQGRTVALIERGRHPRFAIGESTTPLTNLLLEELADRYNLPSIRAFSKWGTWQDAHPDIACGLKRGFSFMFHRPDEPFGHDPSHARQLLVAASPNDETSDTHWYRPEFDAALARWAEGAGAIYFDETRLEGVHDTGATMRLAGQRHGKRVSIDAGFVIDASGPRGFLATAFDLGASGMQWLQPTQGLYTHFEHVDRWDRLLPPDGTPPYPPDDAALHHVFPGGWIWVLRFNNGITSAGAALTDPLAHRLVAPDGSAAWDRLLRMFPSIGEQFAGARESLPFIHSPRIGFRTHTVAGDRWALLPSAAGVIDPLLSTGFALTLLGLSRLLHVLETTVPGAERLAALAVYERTTLNEIDLTERLVAALYAAMADPELFKRLSLLYFAAASHTETVRRLGQTNPAPGFLLCDHPQFASDLRTCTDIARTCPVGRARHELFDRIDRAIGPIDTVGFLDRSQRDWYGVTS